MPESTRKLIIQHWKLANARGWEEFRDLLDPEMSYEVPQTREYTDSGSGYLELFRTWPGDWKATIKNLVCERSEAICIIEFTVGTEQMTGISFFTVKDGLIKRVIDYWPEPYEPPPRMTPLLKRRDQ